MVKIDHFKIERTMKICKKCGRELADSWFNKKKSSKDGLQAYCRECQSNLSHEQHTAKKTSDNTANSLRSNEALAKFTPRQLIDELKARGYTGELKYTYTIKL